MSGIILLGGQGTSTEYVANALSEKGFLSAIIIENPPNKKKMLKRRIRLLGIFAVFGQLQFMLFERLFLRNKQRTQEIETRFSLRTGLPKGVLVHKVASVNSTEARKLLTELAPVLVVVNGTRIISKRVLDSIDAIFINTHVGITPQYRGVHGGYWALADGNVNQFGTTVHYVDQGVDTGGVIVQKTGRPEPIDNFSSYPVLQYGLIIEDLVETSIKILDGERPLKQEVSKMPSKQYFHPTLMGYLWRKIFRGIK